MFRRKKAAPAQEAAPVPQPAGFVYVTARSLASKIDGQPLADVLIDLYDALANDMQGTTNRITDALIHAGAHDLLLDMPYDASMHLTPEQFAALLAAIAAGQLYYVSNRYDDELPSTFVQTTDQSQHWTLAAWGELQENTTKGN